MKKFGYARKRMAISKRQDAMRARARKQYRYHRDWSQAQAATKFNQLTAFGECLPAIRRRLERDLKADPGDAEFALAAAVMMIDRTSLRVGHPEYARENGSFGTLTLRRRHLTLDDDNMLLRFTAKGGKKVKRVITDRKLQKLLHKINDLPGATLLTWTNDAGDVQTLTSQQLNEYLADASGVEHVTAKTFRTWAGTLAAYEIAQSGRATIKDMADAAAQQLHNTPTVARNSYIHPDVIDLAGKTAPETEPLALSGLRVGEQRLMGFLTAH